MSFQDYADELEKKAKIGEHKPMLIAGIAIVIVVIFAFVGLKLADAFGSSGDYSYTSESNSNEDQSNSTSENKTIYVYVSGSVKAPGLIELNSGERVAAAIEKAGGFSEDADTSATNLAKVAEDGEQISIPSRVASADAANAETGGGDSLASSTSSQTGKVNINTADVAQLQTISGIGPSKAQKIVDYRQSNGKFKSIDDLTNVSGIGEKTLSSIRDQICV